MLTKPSLRKDLPEVPNPSVEPAFSETFPASTRAWFLVGNALFQEKTPEGGKKPRLFLQTEEALVVINQALRSVLQFAEYEVDPVIELEGHRVKVRHDTAGNEAIQGRLLL